MSGAPTRDEWLKAIAEVETLPSSDPAFLSGQELRASLGLTRHQMLRLLAKLKEAGKIEVGAKFVKDSTGRPQRVTAYKLLS